MKSECCKEVVDVTSVVVLGSWLSLRTAFQSLVLALALRVKSLVLAFALKVQSLPRTPPKTKAKDNTTESITYLILWASRCLIPASINCICYIRYLLYNVLS